MIPSTVRLPGVVVPIDLTDRLAARDWNIFLECQNAPLSVVADRYQISERTVRRAKRRVIVALGQTYVAEVQPGSHWRLKPLSKLI